MMRPLAACLALAAVTAAAPPARAQAIPDSPDKLSFPPLAFQPPRAADHRVVLKNGMVVFIAEDKALPLVNVSITVRTGSWLDPDGKEGLAAFTGAQMRRGGTESLTAEQLDEKLDFLAAQVGTGIGGTSGFASLNCLGDNLDESLRLFVDVLRRPRFQEDRLALAKEQSLQEMQKRNDDPAGIEGREWGVLLYGPSHFTNRFTTAASVKSIAREDMVAFHRRAFYPANMIAAVSGSFDRAAMVKKLEAAFAGWPSPRAATPAIPD
ncbi:MAG: pitrilysin family protein, partial [Vicinamibacteria bacterium]